MKRWWSVLVAFFLLGSVPACAPAELPAVNAISPSPASTASPTAAPDPSPQPTATPPLSKTERPAPERTLLPIPTAETVDISAVHLGDRDYVPPGGYSFQIPEGLYFNVLFEQTALFNADRTVLLFLSGDLYSLYGDTFDEMVERYLRNFFRGPRDQYKVTASHSFSVAGKDGMIYEIDLKWDRQPMQAQAVVLKVGAEQYMYALGCGRKNYGKGQHPWEEQGRMYFHALLHSLTFLPVSDEDAEEKCPIARDPTYGYEKDNSIQLGGFAAKGPDREKIFLENLRTADGKKISYYRTGYVDTRSGTVDVFEVTADGKKVLLYLNGETFYYPQIPQGFTCDRAISLRAP